MADQEHQDHLLMIWLLTGILAFIGGQFFLNRYKHVGRGGTHARLVAPSGIYGAALDNSLGQVTPDHLLHYGPTMRPATWRPHKVKYPATPGMELERLMYGAPGSYNCVTPKAERGWLFAPPAEVDY